MIIRKYACKRFAGIKDKGMNFEDGLNVILGSNEAGKSTLVEGIYSVLFKPSKLGFKSTEDKEFRGKFMPVSSGDSIDGELVLSHGEKEYILSKEWGTEAFSKLILPSSDIIKSEENIQEALKEILLFGEGTYTTIFFSKQIHIKEAIQKIIDNKEATSEVSTLLRRAIMELDGISLDILGEKIQTEVDSLFKRWDIEKHYPENNRGVSNPYKVGFGEIVHSFYKKENIRLEMDNASEAEKQFNEICNELKNVEQSLIDLKKTKEAMEKLENDVIQRSIIEPQIGQFDLEMSLLSKINREWPQSEMRLKQLEVELVQLKDDYQKLETEKGLAKQLIQRNMLAINLEKVDGLNRKIVELNNQIGEINPITKEDILNLETNYNDMLKTEAMIKAGVIIGELKYYSDTTDILVTKDLEAPMKVNVGQVFSANGYIKIEIKDLLEIELKSGDIDFLELRNQYEVYKQSYESTLVTVGVKSISEAKTNKDKLDAIYRSIESCKEQVEELLEDSSYEVLKEKVDSYGDLSHVRSLDIIEAEGKDIDLKRTEFISDKKVIDANIQRWSEEYVDVDGLFNKIIQIKMEQKAIKDKLVQLAPLPEEYESTESFREILSKTREDYEKAQELLTRLKEEYYVRERDLPTSTYEELLNEYNAEEIRFKKRLDRGKKLLKIKEAFDSTRKKMDESSFTPVIDAFSNYINILTNGNYKASDIDKDFNVKLIKDNQTMMPLNLLSSGTYDSVALALRLSILEYILGETKGFLILDDCLVDLDPYRKEIAVKLICEFANKHQVIFTTCSPDTASLLGGYLIQI